jgi:hypothetical protein
MTDLGDTSPGEPETERVAPEDQAEAIAGAYEEEAALTSGPDDLGSLAVRIRKIEERLATIEDYLGTPPSKAGTLEERIEGLEGEL